MSRRLALVFPGQGSQTVGMGKVWAERFAAARDTFAEADEALACSISGLCWNGPETDLTLTVNTQPALLTTAVATLRACSDLAMEPAYVAGHSLGEYAALVAAGSLEFTEALRLVRLRGRFMQEAVPVGEGAMAAILGAPASEVEKLTLRAGNGEVCTIANLNAPEQTVIAGHVGAVERAVAMAPDIGARRALLLPVSAPFHSPLMAAARERLTPHLEQATFADPEVPVVCNIDARPVTGGAAAREALIRQIDGPVRWVESVDWMAAEGGVELFVEVGPGKVLAGLNKRIAPLTRTISLDDPDGLEKLQEELAKTS